MLEKRKLGVLNAVPYYKEGLLLASVAGAGSKATYIAQLGATFTTNMYACSMLPQEIRQSLQATIFFLPFKHTHF
ncbi:hypothetical protein RAB80_018348 [Fusarium oxysporum f. sp. vasinfectum]|nr:hypothetical protein RAB80_018348 [Fusarium oxysporum f. sp. vasinfectum]